MLWSAAASNPWFWSNGKPFQMAKEAAMIPFDQRSLAQRLAVREATRAGTFPLSDASAEPNIVQLASSGELPAYIRHDKDGRLNVSDIMAWHFLTMMQPDPREGTIAWFWGTACHMFATLGLFEKLTKECGSSRSARIDYIPRRFIHEGEFTAKDIAVHCFSCGLTKRMASTYLWDFARIYIEMYLTAEEPNWTLVPTPLSRETRPPPTRRRQIQKRNNTAKQTATPKTLAERIGESDASARTLKVPAYDESPPAGT